MKKFLQVLGVVFLALMVFVAVGMGYLYFRQKSRFLVTGASMMPTLLKKELVEVDREAFRNRAPERGEVIVYRNLEDQKFILVGRIVGVPGDEISFSKRRLQVNGSGVYQTSVNKKVDMAGSQVDVEEATESLGPMTYSVWYQTDVPHIEYSTVKVPPEQYFVMGDNRDNAKDSRFGGPIPRANMVGSVKSIIESSVPERVGRTLSQ